MSVKYILYQAGAKMGLPDISVGSQNRTVLLRLLNEAARELYPQADVAGTLVEQVFKVNGDQTISLPSYVGRIRGVREYASMQPWHINQMRPRYNESNWMDMWRGWRLKNKQALMASVTNESVGVISVSAVETPNIVVTVTGPTPSANLISETVTLDAMSKQTINTFLDYTSVKKDRVNTLDITLSDIDGKLLTVIPNNEHQAKYQIVDISACPWLSQDTSVQDNYVEILYKKTLPYLNDDGDEYPAFDFDDVIVNKMMQLWMEEQNKADAAEAYDNKATRSTARIHEDQNRATEDVVSLSPNPHDTILPRIGSGVTRRFGRRFW